MQIGLIIAIEREMKAFWPTAGILRAGRRITERYIPAVSETIRSMQSVPVAERSTRQRLPSC